MAFHVVIIHHKTAYYFWQSAKVENLNSEGFFKNLILKLLCWTWSSISLELRYVETVRLCPWEQSVVVLLAGSVLLSVMVVAAYSRFISGCVFFSVLGSSLGLAHMDYSSPSEMCGHVFLFLSSCLFPLKRQNLPDNDFLVLFLSHYRNN